MAQGDISSKRRNRLQNLVKRGNLDELHAVIRRRRWSFATPAHFSRWLVKHRQVSQDRHAHATFRQLQFLSPHDLQATLASLGLMLNIREPVEKSVLEQIGRIGVTRAQWDKHPVPLARFVSMLPKIPRDITSTRDFRKWLQAQPISAKKIDFAGKTDKLADEVVREKDWQEAGNKRAALSAISGQVADYMNVSSAIEGLKRAARILPDSALQKIGALKGVSLTPSPAEALQLPDRLRTFLKSEFSNLSKAPENTSEARGLLAAYAALYHPSFRGRFRQLPKFGEFPEKKGSPTVKTYKKRKKWELGDPAFQRAKRNRRLALISARQTEAQEQDDELPNVVFKRTGGGRHLIINKPRRKAKRNTVSTLKYRKPGRKNTYKGGEMKWQPRRRLARKTAREKKSSF